MSRCGCDKELVSQSEYSPGIVHGDEPVVYSLIDPETFADGSIKAIRHDRLKKGQLSVTRANYISGAEARQKTVLGQLERDSSRTEHGFAWALCHEIKAIQLKTLGIGAFCVIDDALEGFPAHAHLGYSQVEDKKNDRLGARGDLLILFQRRGHIEDWTGEPFSEGGGRLARFRQRVSYAVKYLRGLISRFKPS